MNVRGCSKPWVFSLAVVITFFSFLPVSSGQIGGTVELQYSTTNTGGGDNLLQRYNLNYGKTLSEVLEYTLGLDATIGSERRERSTFDISPFVFINMEAPDISATLGYNSDQREDKKGNTLTTNNIFLHVKPHLFEEYVDYSANFNRRRLFDDFTPRQTDFVTNSWRLNLNHVLPVPGLHETSFNYTFNQNVTTDELTDLKENNLSGTMLVGYSASISERVNISGNLDLRSSRRRFSIPQPPFNAVFTPFGLFAIDLTPLTGGLANTPALVDGDLNTSAGISLQNISNNIGADLAGTKRTEMIFINMVPGFIDFIPEVVWEVYKSGDGINWVLVTSSPSVFYNITNSRYEITFPAQSTRFIKVVNTAVSSQLNAIVTEIEVFTLIPGLTQVSETSNKELDSNINISSDITDNLSLNGSFFYAVDLTKPQKQQDSTSIISSGMSYMPSKYFNLTLNTNRNSFKDSSPTETSSFVEWSYIASISTQLLDFIRPSLSLSLSDRDEDKVSVSRRKSAAVNLSFLDELYPGIEMGISGNITETEDLVDFIDILSYGTSIEVNLRPKSWISLTNSYSVFWSKTKEILKRVVLVQSDSIRSSLSITPSPIINFFNTIFWNDGNYTSSFRVTWLPANKLQLSATYRLNESEDISSSLDFSIFWRVKRNLNFIASWDLEFNPNMIESERRFNARLIAHF